MKNYQWKRDESGRGAWLSREGETPKLFDLGQIEQRARDVLSNRHEYPSLEAWDNAHGVWRAGAMCIVAGARQ